MLLRIPVFACGTDGIVLNGSNSRITGDQTLKTIPHLLRVAIIQLRTEAC